jgi:hypothetical protein
MDHHTDWYRVKTQTKAAPTKPSELIPVHYLGSYQSVIYLLCTSFPQKLERVAGLEDSLSIEDGDITSNKRMGYNQDRND